MAQSNGDELKQLLEQNGWKFYEELNGFRKESKHTIPMFSGDQSKSYDSLSHGNYLELKQAILADRKQHELEARIDELEALEPILNYMGDQVKLNKRINELKAERERLGK